MENKRFIILLVCLLCFNCLCANNEKYLCVLLKSGTQINIAIEKRPTISFNGTIMHVGDGDYQIDNVRKWMIGNPDEIANTIENMKSENAIVYKNGILNVGNRTDVRAYNTAGVEMPVSIRNGQVDMTAWPQDVYVIKAGTETLKLRKQ